jgi:hypothetical protein
MQSFIFSYGGKQLAEHMVGLMNALVWNGKESFGRNLARIAGNFLSLRLQQRAIPLAVELFLNVKRPEPSLRRLHPDLRAAASRYAALVRDHSHHFKKISYALREKIVTQGAYHARLSDAAMWLHGMACTLSKLDRRMRQAPSGPQWERDRAAGLHFLDMAELEIGECFRRLYENDDATMREAAKAELAYTSTLSNRHYVLPEKSPVAAGQGRKPQLEFVHQFPGDTVRAGSREAVS